VSGEEEVEYREGNEGIGGSLGLSEERPKRVQRVH